MKFKITSKLAMELDKNLRPSLVFFFFFFITHHSSLNFRHSSFKIPQFPIPTCLAQIFNFSSLSFFYFLWDHTWAPCQAFLLAYPSHTISSFHITHYSFPFPFSPQYFPKTRDFNLGIPLFIYFFPSTPNTRNNHFGSELEAQTQKIH